MDKISSTGMGLIIAISATLAILSFNTTWIMTHAQEAPQVNSQENVTGIQNTTLTTTNGGEEDDNGVAEEGSGEDADEPGDIDVGDDED